MNFGYDKYNKEIINDSGKKRICGYFVVSDLHKITSADIRLRSDELFEEIAGHDDWILESIVWDANHKVGTNRDGLNIILEKAKNNEFDILLMHHVTLISRQGGKTFDYALQLSEFGKSIYGVVGGLYSLDELAETLHLSIAKRKQYEEFKKVIENRRLEKNE